jgi:ATP-dependent Lon protease
VSTVDEGIEILTRKKAGKRLKRGRFEPGSINAIVDTTLAEYARKTKKMGG